MAGDISTVLTSRSFSCVYNNVCRNDNNHDCQDHKNGLVRIAADELHVVSHEEADVGEHDNPYAGTEGCVERETEQIHAGHTGGKRDILPDTR